MSSELLPRGPVPFPTKHLQVTAQPKTSVLSAVASVVTENGLLWRPRTVYSLFPRRPFTKSHHGILVERRTNVYLLPPLQRTLTERKFRSAVDVKAFRVLRARCAHFRLQHS